MAGWRRNFVIATFCVVWAGAVGAAFVALHRYESNPGRAAGTPQTCPLPSHVALDPHRHVLVMFVHPKCPCSAASIEQLDRIIARAGDRLKAYVIEVIPQDAPADFAENSRTIRAAAAIPGVSLLTDRGQAEALRFGAQTSGHVLLYAPDGKLEFSGGITAARGHAGDNAACDAIIALAGGAPTTAAAFSPVYGCSLIDPASSQPAAR